MIDSDKHYFRQTRSSAAVSGVFWSGINIVVPTILSLVVFVITSHLLTPKDFGVVALAATFAAAVAALIPAGFGDALVQRMEKNSEFLDSVFWLCLGVGAALYLLLSTVSPYLARSFHTPLLSVVIPVLGLKVIFDTVAIVPTALVTKALSFRLIARRTVIATMMSATISIGLVLTGFGFWALVASQLANSAVGALAMFMSTRWRPKLRFRMSDIRVLAGYGAFATGTRLLTFLGSQGDQMMVGLVLGTSELGFYYFARRVFAILNDVTSGALNMVAHPLFAGIQNDLPRVRRGFLIATFVSSLVAFPIFIGLAVVADRAILVIFGAKWLGSLWALRYLCALGILTCIGILQAGLITSLGRANWWFYYQLLVGIINIPIFIFFARFGSATLILAIVIKTYMLWPIPVIMTLRLLSMKLRGYFMQFIPALLASFAMILAIFVARRLLPAMPLSLELTLDIIAGGLGYIAVLTLCARSKICELLLVTGMLAKIRRFKASSFPAMPR